MEIKRGTIAIVTPPNDYGKPRPAVIVQSDLLNPTHASVMVCLITSDITEDCPFRIKVEPSDTNGLNVLSDIMVDKLYVLRTHRIKECIGILRPEEVLALNDALRLVLNL